MDLQPKPKRRIFVNLIDCKYPVFPYIVRSILNWRVAKDHKWDVQWTDSAITTEQLASLRTFQKINHFPGMFGLSRKDYLARNLSKLKAVYVHEYDFFPKTWVLPMQMSEFRSYSGSKKQYFIVKPECSSQGKGIYLIQKPEELHAGERCVVQRYVARPYVLDELKFDMRIYVLVTSCSPLRVYIHEEGLARFATEHYHPPAPDNSSDIYMHLTNYAINRHNDKYSSDKSSYKRTIRSVFSRLDEIGCDIDGIWRKICDIVVKTICSVQPNLAHLYKSAQPDDVTSGMCFELLGFDIILDSDLQPWVLEVNHSPSFATDSSLDEQVKITVLTDVFRMLGVSTERRKRMKREKETRNWVGKSINERKNEKEELNLVEIQKKDKWERKHLGGFVRIFPGIDDSKYMEFMSTAGRLWESWTCAKPKSGSIRPVCSVLSSQRPRTASVPRSKPTERPVLERLYAQSPPRHPLFHPQNSAKSPLTLFKDNQMSLTQHRFREM